MSLKIELAGEEIALLPERGLHWARESLLLVADWHVGKAATFRAAGIGVPEGDLGEEFARLEAMIERTGVREVVVLGDFVHARAGLTEELIDTVVEWTSSSGVELGLVCGNHDRSAGMDRVGKFGLEPLGESVVRGPFVLQHEPGDSERGYVLSGHVHPCVRLGEGKAGGLRAPCFWFGERCGVLPAFGGFSGNHRIDAAEGDRLFAVGDDEVIEVAR